MNYHVSPDGIVRPCHAEICPFGTRVGNKTSTEQYVENKKEIISDYENYINNNENYSELQAIKRGEFVNKTTDMLIKSKKDTYSLFYNEDTKRWDKKRAKLHEEVLLELNELYKHIPSERKVVFSAGLPGAGKTTVLQRLSNKGVQADQFATISSDDIKEILAKKGAIPKVEGLTPMEASTLVHEESSILADRFLVDMSRQGKNVIYDFTCKTLESAEERVEVLKDNNYEVEDMQFVFVDIPIEIAEERTIGRYQYGLNQGLEEERQGRTSIGGRYLPKNILHKNTPNNNAYHSRNAEAIVDVWSVYRQHGLPKPIVYDNSGNSFVDPTYEPEEMDFDEFANR